MQNASSDQSTTLMQVCFMKINSAKINALARRIRELLQDRHAKLLRQINSMKSKCSHQQSNGLMMMLKTDFNIAVQNELSR